MKTKKPTDPKMSKLSTTRLHEKLAFYKAMDQSLPTTQHMVTRVSRELKRRGI